MKHKVAIVTGAGSGVGRVVAIRLAGEGWQVAAVGRRAEALQETAQLAGLGRVHACPFDVADAKAAAAVVEALARKFGGVGALVNSAGTNLPRRGLDVLSVEDFHTLVDVNLNGTFHFVHAVLPVMRKAGEGTIAYSTQRPLELRIGKLGAKDLETVAVPKEFLVWPGSPRDPGQGDPLVTFRYDQDYEFCEAILQGRPCRPSFADGARAQAVMDAAVESDAQGRWVEVPKVDGGSAQ